MDKGEGSWMVSTKVSADEKKGKDHIHGRPQSKCRPEKRGGGLGLFDYVKGKAERKHEVKNAYARDDLTHHTKGEGPTKVGKKKKKKGGNPSTRTNRNEKKKSARRGAEQGIRSRLTDICQREVGECKIKIGDLKNAN